MKPVNDLIRCMPRFALATLLCACAHEPTGDSENTNDRRSVTLEGETKVGWRFVNVDGNEAQYDADVNLDAGPRLLSLALAGIVHAGTREDRFRAEVEGVDDPSMRGKVEFRRGQDWSLEGHVARDDFPFVDATELHPLHTTRRRAGGSFEWTPEGRVGPRARVGYERRERRGDALLSRLLEGDLLGPVDGSDRRDLDQVHANVSAPLGDVTLSASLFHEREVRSDRRRLQAPSPQDPNVLETEDFGARGTRRAHGFSFASEADLFGGGARFDSAVRLTRSRVASSFRSVETGLTSGAISYTEDELGDARLERTDVSFDSGLSFDLGEQWLAGLLYEVFDVSESGRSDLLTLRQEPTGSNPTILTGRTRLETDLLRQRAGAELTFEADRDLHLTAGIDWGLTSIDFDGATGPRDTNFREWRPRFELHGRLDEDTRVDLTLAHRSVDDAFQRIDPGETQEGRLRLRHALSERGSLWFQARGGLLRNRVSDADGRTYALSAGLSLEVERDLRVSLQHTFAAARTDFETSITLGGNRVQRDTRFRARTHTSAAHLELDFGERLHSRFGIASVLADGRSTFQNLHLEGLLEHSFSQTFSLGLEVRGDLFDGRKRQDVGDYEAFSATLFLRARFP